MTDSVFVTISDSPDPVVAGEQLTYGVSVLFAGIVMGSHVTLIDTLPAGATYVSSHARQGFCEYSEGIVECNIDIAPAGEHVTVEIVVTPTEVGTLHNTATVRAADPNLQSNIATEETVVVGRRSLPAGGAASSRFAGQISPSAVGSGAAGGFEKMALNAAEGVRKLMREQEARIEFLESRLAAVDEARSRPPDASETRAVVMARLSWLLLGAIGGAGVVAMMVPKRRGS